MEKRVCGLALFNLGIDINLRGCDLVALKVRGDQVTARAVVMRHKPASRDTVQKWIKTAGLKSDDFLSPSRIHDSPHDERAVAPSAGSAKVGPPQADDRSTNRSQAAVQAMNRAPPARLATRMATCGPRGSEPVALHDLKEPFAGRGTSVAQSHPDRGELQRDAECQQRADRAHPGEPRGAHFQATSTGGPQRVIPRVSDAPHSGLPFAGQHTDPTCAPIALPSQQPLRPRRTPGCRHTAAGCTGDCVASAKGSSSNGRSG